MYSLCLRKMGSIRVRVHQEGPDWFNIVEQTVCGHGGGTWRISGSEHVLKLEDYTSGALRFSNGAGDFFVVVIGIQKVPWTDIAANLEASETGVAVHPTWHRGGSRAGGRNWEDARTAAATDAKGRRLSVFVTGEDPNLIANIYIG